MQKITKRRTEEERETRVTMEKAGGDFQGILGRGIFYKTGVHYIKNCDTILRSFSVMKTSSELRVIR